MLKYTWNQTTGQFEKVDSTSGNMSYNFEIVKKSRIFADKDGALGVFLDGESGKMKIVSFVDELGGVDVPAYDVGFSDFDIVYYDNYLGTENIENVFIYAGVSNTDNITQIQLNRDMTTKYRFWTYDSHIDWFLNREMGRCTGIASNVHYNDALKAH